MLNERRYVNVAISNVGCLKTVIQELVIDVFTILTISGSVTTFFPYGYNNVEKSEYNTYCVI